MLPVVRKHHYVWAYYLSAWSSENDKSVWYITGKGKISRDSTKGLSREQDFNKIHKLSDADIAYIEKWPNGNSENLQNFHRSQLQHFKRASLLIDSHLGLEKSPWYAELKNMSEAVQHGIFEQTHTAIENLFRPILDELKQGKDECLNETKNMINFCNFLAQQLFRTKKIRDRCFAGLDLISGNKQDVERFKALFEKNWWFLSYKLGINLGHSLCNTATTDKHIFIRNETGVDFITGDSPVINIHETSTKGAIGKPPEEMDLYFPVSPKVGYIISTSDRYDHLASAIDISTVDYLNHQIRANSHLTIYGASRESMVRAIS